MSTEAVLNLEWRELAAGCGFTEGPVARGNEVVFTSINRGMLFSVGLGGGEAQALVETGGGPNGLAIDAAGAIWVAQNGGKVVPTKSAIACVPSIQKVAADGSVSVVLQGGLNAPNDCAFGPDGRLWFTDPTGSSEVHEPKPGCLRALDVATGACEVILDGLAHPNGLAFGPEPDTLFVGETHRGHIIKLVKSADGWRHAGVYATLTHGEPDGMAFDASGCLWVAATKADALVVIAPGGKGQRLVPLGPSFPTNVCFAGADRRSLVVTAPKGGRVLCASVSEPGIPLAA